MCVGGACGSRGVVGGGWFLALVGICSVNWGHTAKHGYPPFLVRAVYSITGAIGCVTVKAPHLAIGGNVASCPAKSLNSMIIYRSSGCPRLHGV